MSKENNNTLKIRAMRTLTKEQIDCIRENYTADAVEAMLNPENVDKVLDYVERAAECGVAITYNQAFWGNKAVEVYVLDNHLRVFMDSSIGGLQPLSEADAKGDWGEWLKRAYRMVRVEGWCKEVPVKKTPARIIACCDPYHARMHYNGEEVVKDDMGTPVQWVVGKYDSIEEAREALWKMCLEDKDRNMDWMRESDDDLSYWRELLASDPDHEDWSDDDIEEMLSWYKGEGVYNSINEPVMLKGGDGYTNDVMTYRVEVI